MKKYSLEVLLAFQSIKEKVISTIKDAVIDEEGILTFNIDIKSNKGNYKKDVLSLLWAPLDKQYRALLATEMLAEGYMCIPIQGGWVVVSPEGEEYQLQETECTCGFRKDEPCKHLILRDFTLDYRARVQKEKSKRGLT